MSVYVSQKPNAPVELAEFSQQDGQQFALLHLRSGAGSEGLRHSLINGQSPVSVLSDRQLENGDHVLMCRGDCAEQDVLNLLEQSGASMAPQAEEKQGFNPWKWRGLASIVGQSLQLLAAYFAPKSEKGNASTLYTFAGLNLAANFCNIIFGAQHKHDKHQLAFLKNQINEGVAPYVIDKTNLPDVAHNPLDDREKVPESFGEQVYHTLQKYSVTIGEIGFRVLGTVSLVFPFAKAGEVINTYRQDGFGEAFQTALNKNPDGTLAANFYVGLGMLAGKGISFFAKEPDPYNPKPQNAFDRFREKHAFHASSVIEGLSTAGMMVNQLQTKHITFNKETETPLYRDYMGALGNLVFIGGYGIRLAAPYGSLEVNMQELYAHVSDALAQVPREQLPDVLADTVMGLKAHFHDKKDITTADIYAGIASDLEKHHQITLPIQAPRGHVASKPFVPAAAREALDIASGDAPLPHTISEPRYEQTLNQPPVVQQGSFV